MGNTDSIPIVSQVKSGVQLVCGDAKGAAATQERFFHECPIVSQATSVGYLIAGNTKDAIKTQKRCGKGLLSVADGIPVVGHFKGGIHYLVGDKEGGHRAMKSATRTTGVMAGGVGGFFLGGPPGAIAGGIYGGVVTDAGTTIVTKEKSGYIAALENVIENPNPGDIFDLCLMPVADGLAGHSAGSLASKLTTPTTTVAGTQADLIKAGNLKLEAYKLYEITEAKAGLVPEIQYIDGMRQVSKLYGKASALEGNVAMSLKASAKLAAEVKSATTSTAGTAASQTAVSQKEALKEKKRLERKREGERRKDQQRQRAVRTPELEESSSDSETECICIDVSIPVVFCNMQSVNPLNRSGCMENKFDRLRAVIQRNNPGIVALVETWLNDRHTNEFVLQRLGLQNYHIFRQDRSNGHHEDTWRGEAPTGFEDRRGGGILIAWRETVLSNGNSIRMSHVTSEAFADSVMIADITTQMNCRACNNDEITRKFTFSVVYRRPARDTDDSNVELTNHLVHIGYMAVDSTLGHSGWSMVGDFNWRDGIEDPRILNILEGTEGAEGFPSQRQPTHRDGGSLDFAVGSPGHIGGLAVSNDLISDHHALVYTLILGTDYSANKRCDEC
ncbi:uncharacterized protein LOC119086000 [Bradysia coprophila]|uniref:uncharacterized protein LOC119086000 n=1 Tax=Bradysia coprophila TaxID=38358 RepID=UPI00187DCD79|nr:uncharacterized protein LOC119086000 [Bradysia coprophila]